MFFCYWLHCLDDDFLPGYYTNSGASRYSVPCIYMPPPISMYVWLCQDNSFSLFSKNLLVLSCYLILLCVTLTFIKLLLARSSSLLINQLKFEYYITDNPWFLHSFYMNCLVKFLGLNLLVYTDSYQQHHRERWYRSPKG